MQEHDERARATAFAVVASGDSYLEPGYRQFPHVQGS
jgi:hypothetical protein